MKPAEIFRLVKEHSLSVDTAFELIKKGESGERKKYSGGDSDRSTDLIDQLEQSPDIMFYTCAWQEAPLGPIPTETRIGNVLLFDHDEILRTYLLAQPRWTSAGSLALAIPANRFVRHNRTTYSIKPDNSGDYGRLLDALEQERFRPNLILHCWSCTPHSQTYEGLTLDLQKGCFAVFYLLQALLSRAPREPRRLLYAYTFDKGPPPICAAMGGLARTMRLEAPQMIFKVVGLAPDQVGERAVTTRQQSDALWAELQDKDASEIEMLYRGDCRLVRRLQPLGQIPTSRKSAYIKKGSVWIITGGLGGLGLMWSEVLAERLGARLVLCGRSDPTEQQKERLQMLGALGAQVVYVKADVATHKGSAAILAATEERFGTVNGIIHAAGVIRDAFLVKKSPIDFKAVLAPKVYGAYYLDALSRKLPLDFFILFSAVAGVFGNPGQSDYAFANAFLDAFAVWREDQRVQGRRQGRTLTINWPLWAEGGMTMDAESQRMLRHTAGVIPLPAPVGLEAFFNSLALNTTQVLVLSGERNKLQRVLGFHTAGPLAAAGTPRETGPMEDTVLGQAIQQELVELVSDLIKIDPQRIEPNGDMANYGLDSIKLTALANRINDRFGLEMTPAIFFELAVPSIAACASYLLSTQREHLRRYYGEPARGAVPPTYSDNSMLHTPGGNLQQTYPAAFQNRCPNLGAKTSSPSCEAQIEAPRNLEAMSPSIKTAAAKSHVFEPIAIIGMSGKMPCSVDLNAFWDHLEAGDDLIGEMPSSRANRLSRADIASLSVGGFIDDVDQFDAALFNIPAEEARMMDPQQRLFLESVWQATQDAGIKPADMSGTRTGVFVGVMAVDYQDVISSADGNMKKHLLTGVSPTLIPNRVSWLLNLHGPSVLINTACSSSLVAIHRAVKALQSKECEMAYAGGVNVILNFARQRIMELGGQISKSGRCKSFDAQADGYVRGEGVGVLLLQPLNAALARRNPIHAVIRSSIETHSGRTNFLTAPNPPAQTRMLVEAYEQAGIEPDTVTYIEANGTATPLGDSVEVRGIIDAFDTLYQRCGKKMPDFPSCGLGTVKTNIGHLEAAAGIAGVIKVVLAMQNGQIPANLHYTEPNPQIRLQGTPFYIAPKTRPWERVKDESGQPISRRAGVSALGLGGTNAHVVLEEFQDPTPERTCSCKGPWIIPLSATDESCLNAYAKCMSFYFQGYKSTEDDRAPAMMRSGFWKPAELCRIAHTLQVGRESYDFRLALVAPDIKTVIRLLQEYIEGATNVDGLYQGNAADSRKYLAPLRRPNVQQLLCGLVNANEPDLLACLWVMGFDIQWPTLGTGDHPRVHLPSVPLNGKSYWFESKISPANAAALSESDGNTHSGAVNRADVQQNDMSKSAKPILDREYPKTLDMAALQEIVAELLQVPLNAIDKDRALSEMGFDSMIGMRMINRIKEEYQLYLPPVVIYECQTLHQILSYLEASAAVATAAYQPNAPAQDQKVGEIQKFPLSSGQKSLWIVHKLAPDTAIYNVPLALRLDGVISVDALKEAFRSLCCRHILLRSKIMHHELEPCWVVDTDMDVDFETAAFTIGEKSGFREHLADKINRAFNLKTGPLIRMSLLSEDSHKHILLIVAHHIAVDGSSFGILLDELFRLYGIHLNRACNDLPAIRTDFPDFVRWQQGLTASQHGKVHEEYWLAKLEGTLPKLNLPTMRHHQSSDNFLGDFHEHIISVNMTEQIKLLARKLTVYPFSVMLSVFEILLHRYTQQDELLIAVPSAGRPEARFEKTVGHFVNMLVLRNAIESNQSFKQVLNCVHSELMETMKHQDYPFNEIVRKLTKAGLAGRSPLVQAVFSYQNWFRSQDVSEFNHMLLKYELKSHVVTNIHQQGEFELTLDVIEKDEQFVCYFKFDPDLFELKTITQMAGHYEALLCAVLQDPDSSIAQLPLMSQQSLRLMEEMLAADLEAQAD